MPDGEDCHCMGRMTLYAEEDGVPESLFSNETKLRPQVRDASAQQVISGSDPVDALADGHVHRGKDVRLYRAPEFLDPVQVCQRMPGKA